jgi:hypothetical protein
LEEEIRQLRSRNDYLEDLLISASEFKITSFMYVQERGRGTWCVFNLGDVLNADSEWEYEPTPSNRDEAFLERTRFDRDTALRLAKEKANAKRK